MIDGEESHYEISSQGRVRNSNNGHIRKINRGRVNLCHKGHTKTYSVSKLMESMFGVKRERKPHKSKNVGKNNGSARQVICLNTLRVFDTIRDSAKWCGLCSTDGISKCCRGLQVTCGKHPILGSKLRWMYYDEWLDMNNSNSKERSDY